MIAAPIPRLSRPARAVALALLWTAACGDDIQGPGPRETTFLSTLIVSNPVTAAVTAGAQPSASGVSTSAGLVYTSLPPGTFPDGERAVIRTRGTGAETSVEMLEGGFDPIPLAATAGDTLDIRIELSAGGLLAYFSVVPPSRPPVVVRTDPPPRKPDVPLNALMLVVFSEPIRAASLTDESVRLLRDGAPVAGTLGFGDSEQLAVTFTPTEPLISGAAYTLLITRAIEDLDGDALAQAVQVDFTTATVSATRVFTQVSAGNGHTCGVTNDTVLYCWGFNLYGQLGIGSTNKTPSPTPVAGGLRFAQVSAGWNMTCSVATDGAGYCWGYEIVDDTLTPRLTPTLVPGNVTFAQVSAGPHLYSHVSGVATDGVAYCLRGICWNSGPSPEPSQSGLTYAQVSSGSNHTCGITTDNAAYCWGTNLDGEFGDGTIDSEGPRPGETAVAGDLSFVQVTAGWRYTCGVTTDDFAYCWGSGFGSHGARLGNGTFDARLTPTPVAGDLRFTQLSASMDHTCGVTTDQVAYCWGRNDKGQLGDGTTEIKLIPTPVAGGLRFAQVSAGDSHTCGITTSDVVYCWGFNHSGQLGSRYGYDTNGNRLTPTPVEF